MGVVGVRTMSEIKPGLVGEVEIEVTPEQTAIHLRSGDVHVFATPMMVRLMEWASLSAVDPLLPPGQTTVGGYIAVHHLAPTPVGMKVRARAELEAVDGRKLTFHVTVHDEVELVGEGTHERWIINVGRFLDRVKEKHSRGQASV